MYRDRKTYSENFDCISFAHYQIDKINHEWNFVIITLHKNSETFVMHIAVLQVLESARMTIHHFCINKVFIL